MQRNLAAYSQTLTETLHNATPKAGRATPRPYLKGEHMRELTDLTEHRNGNVELKRVVDIEDLLVANKNERKNITARRLSDTASKGGLRKVASIPVDALMALDEKGVAMMNGNENELRKFLNEHPEYRTAGGRL